MYDSPSFWRYYRCQRFEAKHSGPGFDSQRLHQIKKEKDRIMDSTFKDTSGKTSVTRIVWAFSVIVIITTWSCLSFMTQEFQSFSMGDAAWFAALFGGKVAQSYIERNGKKKTDPNIEVCSECGKPKI